MKEEIMKSCTGYKNLKKNNLQPIFKVIYK